MNQSVRGPARSRERAENEEYFIVPPPSTALVEVRREGRALSGRRHAVEATDRVPTVIQMVRVPVEREFAHGTVFVMSDREMYWRDAKGQIRRTKPKVRGKAAGKAAKRARQRGR